MNLLVFISGKVVALGPAHLRKGSLSKAAETTAAESATSVASAVSVAAVVTVTVTVVVAGTTVVSSVGGVIASIAVVGISIVAGGVVTVVVPVSVVTIVSVVPSPVIIAVVVVIAIAIVSVSISIVAVVVTTIACVRSLRGIRLTAERNGRGLLGESRSHNGVAQESINGRLVLLRRVGTRILVRLDSVREVGLVLCNLVRDLLQSLCSGDLLRAVGLFFGVNLLDGEAATEGTGKGVVAAANGADVAS